MKKGILAFLVLFLLAALFLFAGEAPVAKEPTWGVNFSEKASSHLYLDSRETYEAILQDLAAKLVRVSVHWDLVEPREREFSFEELDWYMQKAEEYGVKVVLAVGMKTPRWPECHIPSWAESFSKEEQQEELLVFLGELVARYQKHPSLLAWQVENEPLFPFGICPWRDFSFLQKEIELVQFQDSLHEVYTSDSGEASLWMNMARLGDKVAVTMYQKVWFEPLGRYIDYPFPPVFYHRKAWVIEKLYGKEIIVGELQAEPWTPRGIMAASLEEQEATMSIEQFRENIEFARATGLQTFYLWGAEWWYWMKEVNERGEFWQEAQTLF